MAWNEIHYFLIKDSCGIFLRCLKDMPSEKPEKKVKMIKKETGRGKIK